MSKILSGIEVRDFKVSKLKTEFKTLDFVPCLAIVQVGSRPDSTAFIRAKQNLAKKLEVGTKLINLEENISTDAIIELIQSLNTDNSINGIIVQLPLPSHINAYEVIESIDPKKDVDAMTSLNVKNWLLGKEGCLWPATARGLIEMFGYYNIDLAHKNVVIIGRSLLVGKPIAMMCLSQNATVTVCHSQTLNIKEKTKTADIIIVATGCKRLLTADYVKAGQIIIDVGISKNDEGSLVGDVDFDTVSNIVEAITPVPGGVGPMTVLGLFENLLQVCKK
jgi:methylenetetrahydrofolate dehydrogenase (NADP+)/methenyltetrahydrofolate cyclohydrolase